MESELSRVVDVLPGLIWTALPDGHVDFVNQDWCGYTGLAPDEARGQAWQRIVHPDDLPGLLGCWRTILDSAGPGEMEARLRRFDGAYRWFVLRVRPLAGDDGRVVKWCGMNIDVEACQRTGERPHAREVDFRPVFDSIPGSVTVMAPAGTVEYVNRQGRAYRGATLEELRNWKATRVIHPDDLPLAIARWTHSLRTGQPYDGEQRILGADGAYRWFRVRGLPVRDEQGNITRWCFLDVDIDDGKLGQALLAGEKQLLEKVAGGSSLPEILETFCRLVEETLSGSRCGTLLVDPAGAPVVQAVGPAVPDSAIFVAQPTDAGSDPRTAATRLNRQIIVADLSAGTQWDTWSTMAMAHGLHACWATPIRAAMGDAMGAFAVCYERPRSPTSRDMALIDQLTQIASIVIERQRSQVSLAQALDDIRASEDRLRNIVDAIPGFVWSAAPDGKVEFLNQRWYEYTGMALRDARGFGWASAVHPDDADALAAYWQALLEAGQPGEYEARLRRYDGAYRWFLIRAVPQRDASGRLVKWYGANTDIEVRKQAETLLAGEKRLLGMMADGSSLPSILEALCELVETILAGALCSVVLVDPRRTRPSHDATLRLRLLPGAAPHLPSALKEAEEGRAADADEDPVALAAIGKEPVFLADLAREERFHGWCSLAGAHGMRASWAYPIASSGGKVVGVLSILHREVKDPAPAHHNLIAQFTHLADIAIERARFEAALKQSEAFLAKAQRLSLTGTFSWRVGTDDITWSEELYRILELDPGVTPTFELINTRIHPEDIPTHDEMLRRQRREGRDFESEHRLLMPDGRVKYVHLVAHATQDEEGGLEYIAAVQDITQRRLSEEALGRVRSELAHVARVASLGALTASIAHEVNQPLAGIITNANTCLRMLASDPPNIEGARETARRTIRDGHRASDVIQRLRALFAKKDLSVERVDLNEAAREVIAMLLGELQRNSVILYPEFAEGLPPVRGDRVQLQQVILNLVINASDAMQGVSDRPRHMRVGTGLDEDGYVRLAVRDNGIGFAPQDAERIFHAFYTTKNTGMGIGLSVSRSIIDGHGGRLRARINDGPGATFSFAVPPFPEPAAELANGGAVRDTGVASPHPLESF